MRVATCIGCGCTDYHACQGEDGPCSWVEVDYAIGRGVCSACPDHMARWHNGERGVVMLVAKIVKEGETTPFYLERNDIASFPLLLDAQAGDKFHVEWVEMSSDSFEALPQFEHVRLTRQWVVECEAADAADVSGAQGTAADHRAEAERLAAEVAAMGFDIESVAELL